MKVWVLVVILILAMTTVWVGCKKAPEPGPEATAVSSEAATKCGAGSAKNCGEKGNTGGEKGGAGGGCKKSR